MSVPLTTQTVSGDRNIFTGTGDVKIIYNLPAAEAEEHRNLLILLKRVEQFWVEGVLEKSVHTEALLDIDKTVDPEAVDHPWKTVVELPDQTAETLLPGKKNSAVFEEVGRSLLILGEPGSGKTISLLELTRDLINNAKDDPSQPIPVVFNLSTWATKHPTFSDWLIEELTTKYLIPRWMGQSWLKKNRLLLFLDGLDEVSEVHRDNCVEAINNFTQEVGVPGIVVCSRIREYLALYRRLKFSGAIRLQPLSLDQVDAYLARAGGRLAVLRATFQQDGQLQALAQSPLMLSIMSVAYRDKPVAVAAGEKIDTPKAGNKHVFETYIKRMFERKGKANQPFSQEQTQQWLSWLARQMRENSQTIFLIEQLQPSWLRTKWQRAIYTLGSRIFAGILGSLGPGLAFGFVFFVTFYGNSYAEHGDDSLATVAGLKSGLITLLVSSLLGVISGLISGIRDIVVMERNNQTERRKGEIAMRPVVLATSLYVLVWGLLLASVPVSTRGLEALNFMTVLNTLALGLVMAILQLVVFGPPRYRQQTPGNDISTAEAITWSWARARKSSIWGVALLLAVVILMGIFVSLQSLSAQQENDQRVLASTEKQLLLNQRAIDAASDEEDRAEHVALQKDLMAQAEEYRMKIASASRDTFLFVRWLRSLKSSDLPGYFLALLITALAGGVLGAVFGGLTSKVIDLKSSPNQGIRLTVRNALLAGTIIGPIVGLVTGVIVFGIGFSKEYGIYGMVSGVIAGGMSVTLIVLSYGGLDAIKHFVLRALLVHNGNAPKRYADFLDYASSLIILQTVGGGYIFIHRLVLEYFADLSEPAKLANHSQ